MNAHSHVQEPRVSMATREDVSTLVSRYPHVSDSEAQVIVTFIRKGRHLDVGILTADESLKPQLDLFMQEHAGDLRVGFGEGAAVIAAIAGFLVMCWLIWEAVKPGAG